MALPWAEVVARRGREINDVVDEARAIAYARWHADAYRVRIPPPRVPAKRAGLERRILRRGAVYCIAALVAAPLGALIHVALGFAFAYFGVALLFGSWLAYWRVSGSAIIGTRTLVLLTVGMLAMSVVSLIAAVSL